MGLASSFFLLARKEFSYSDFQSESSRLVSAVNHWGSTTTLPPKTLLNLSRVSQLFGHFRLGAELHQMGKAVGLERTCSETNLPALQWALENGATAEAVEVRFEQIIRGNNTEAERAKTLIRGYFGKTALEAVGVMPAPHTAMARLVGEKNVALVGPQKLTAMDLKQILGHASLGIVHPFEKQMERLEPARGWLGFFGDAFKQSSRGSSELLQKWHMLVASYKSKKAIRGDIFSEHERLMFRFPFSSGTRLMMQASIFDTLQFQPSSLSVHASDLYLSRTTHDPTYIPEEKKQAKEGYLFREHSFGTDGFAHHDVMSNFSYTSTLQDRGVITCFGPFRKILTLGLGVYARELEEAHIKPFCSDSLDLSPSGSLGPSGSLQSG